MEVNNTEVGRDFQPNDIDVDDKVNDLLELARESGVNNKELVNDFKIMKGFIGIYPKEEVFGDMRKVVNLSIKFVKKNESEGINKLGEKAGDELEHVVEEKAELNNWLGDGSFLKKTVAYDDWFNGVDMVLEYDIGGDDSKKIALMIDCTTGKDVIDNKINSNIEMMNRGKRRVKYFESQVTDYKGTILAVPVVIGVNQTHVTDLMDNLENRDYIENNPVQIAVLEEIKMQLKMYESIFSKKTGDFYEDVVKELREIRKIIIQALKDKNDLAKKESTREYLNRDDTFFGIQLAVEGKK